MKDEFQPVLVSWKLPDESGWQKVLCKTETELEFFRETLKIKHYEQRVYQVD